MNDRLYNISLKLTRQSNIQNTVNLESPKVKLFITLAVLCRSS